MPEEPSTIDWDKAILSLLSSSEVKQVKKIRKQVLLSLQLPEDDKASKKQFKKAVQGLETNGTVKLDADGTIALLQKKEQQKKKKSKKDKKKEKKRKLEDDDDGDDDDSGAAEADDDDKKSKKKKKSKKEKKRSKTDDDGDNENENEEANKETSVGGDDDDNINEDDDTGGQTTTTDKNRPCKGNPNGVTRLFLGNLPFAVDEASLAAFLSGKVTHIKWITDKETGKFYGSAFCEMDNSVSAADAVALAGEKLIGRPIKINFAPARDGDMWPPKDKVISGNGNNSNKNNGGQAGGSGVKAMSAKPDGCVKLFCGNLSFEIDDDTITKFFASVDAELKAVRWIHHKDSGDFKGVGFAEFWNTEACEKAATLNGKNLLGRPIRIDWTD